MKFYQRLLFYQRLIAKYAFFQNLQTYTSEPFSTVYNEYVIIHFGMKQHRLFKIQLLRILRKLYWNGLLSCVYTVFVSMQDVTKWDFIIEW